MTSRFPIPPFPVGWYLAAWSDELPAKTVKPLRIFGQDLVLFRGESGGVHVLNAHCPHLGTHLGFGGRVEGDTIACPFHGWRFDGGGACTLIPYTRRIPPLARLRTWHAREHDGLIVLWNGQGEPTFEPMPTPELASGTFTPLKRHALTLRTHVQELAENAVDSAHFGALHGNHALRPAVASVDGAVIRSTVEVDADLRNVLGGAPGEAVVRSALEVSFHGLGQAITRAEAPDAGLKLIILHNNTPIEDGTVIVRVGVAVQKMADDDTMNMLTDLVLKDTVRQYEEDRPIWENKVFHHRPVLAEGDGPIPVSRKWAQQFYLDAPPKHESVEARSDLPRE